MRKYLVLSAIMVLIIPALMSIKIITVQAARGAPGSAEFGYGARLEMDGPFFEDGLQLAADLSLDWLAVTVRWSEYSQDNAPAWRKLDQVMKFARSSGIAVMVSLTDPPEQMMTAQGPSPDETARFIINLTKRYAGTLQAIELFPAANTFQGWGSEANPQAYAQLYSAVQRQTKSTGSNIIFVVGGLKPLPEGTQGEDMDDVAFLKGFYNAGSAASTQVIGLQLTELTGDPLSTENGTGGYVLRHYEEIRDVMITNGREKDLIWITTFNGPSGTIQASSKNGANNTNPAYWLLRAYNQLRSQLYIGVTFYRSLNPTSQPASNDSLIQTNGSYHPFFSVLREMIAQNVTSFVLPQNGRPKDSVLDKHRT